MSKKAIKYILIVFSISVLLICFTGCKSNKKDVYGAASDFIKVSHPEKPNTNVFSDDDYTGDNASSSSNSSVTSTSDNNSSSSQISASDSVAASSGDSNSTDNTENNNNTDNLKPSVEPIKGDQGPVVILN